MTAGASPRPTSSSFAPYRSQQPSGCLSLTMQLLLFPQKSRSARLFGRKRPHDGSLLLPTFADCGQGRATSSFAPYRSQQPSSCFSLTMQLLLFRKNHAWLACSVVNALTTARCRYQLLRIADNPCDISGFMLSLLRNLK